MAFKMKGSAFKLNEVATKSTLKQKSPAKDRLPSGAGWDEETVKAHNKDNANNPKHKENMHGEGRNTSIAEKERREAADKSALPQDEKTAKGKEDDKVNQKTAKGKYEWEEAEKKEKKKPRIIKPKE